MRKFGLAACVLLVSFAFVAAEEFTASITKIDGKKVTFYKITKKDGDKKGTKSEEATTMTVADSVKVVKAKFSKGDDGKFKIEAGDPIEGGLENKLFQNEKGTTARITTEGGKITQIMPFGGGMKKKKKKDDVE